MKVSPQRTVLPFPSPSNSLFKGYLNCYILGIYLLSYFLLDRAIHWIGGAIFASLDTNDTIVIIRFLMGKILFVYFSGSHFHAFHKVA